jgi:hypothetical protein
MRSRTKYYIVSGGQTGVDRAALDLAIELGIPCGGWCPRGFLAEDGMIDLRYNLKETPTEVCAERTEWNARDSDGTLVLLKGRAKGGTAFTIECVHKYGRPLLVTDMTQNTSTEDFLSWLQASKIVRLNVAGPRESLSPGDIYRLARRTLNTLFLAMLETVS